MSNKQPYNHEDRITMRRANVRDDAALERLAQLEGREIPSQPLIVAEVDDRILAAVSAADGSAIADPFEPTSHLVELLSAHAHPGVNRDPGRTWAGRGIARRAPWPA